MHRTVKCKGLGESSETKYAHGSLKYINLVGDQTIQEIYQNFTKWRLFEVWGQFFAPFFHFHNCLKNENY